MGWLSMTLALEHAVSPVQDAELMLAGVSLRLRADRSVYWPARRTLLVADTHFGKDSVFRRQGMGVPAGTTAADLARLGAAIEATGASRLVVLGDFFHAPPITGDAWTAQFTAWRARYAGVEIIVTRGNHDRAAALPDAFAVDWRAGAIEAGPFVLRHCPCEHRPHEHGSHTHRSHAQCPRAPVLAGHLHPAIRLRDGAESLRAPVFWRTDCALVLPAFSSFADGACIAPAPGDRLFAVGPDCVVEIGVGARQR